MDRAQEYAAIIRRVIEHYAQFKPAYGDIEIETVLDDVTGHYELMYVGWNRKERVHGATAHRRCDSSGIGHRSRLRGDCARSLPVSARAGS